MKPKKAYVTNAELREALAEARAKGVLTERLAKGLMLIAEKYSRSPQYVGYSYREDMVAEAIAAEARAWDKFDPEKSDNPFAYFTTVCYRAFLKVLNEERKARDIRDELLIEAGANASWNYEKGDME
jgi:hypothetical protein